MKKKEENIRRPDGFDSIIKSLKHRAYPSLIVVETTTDCNLNCSICPRDRLTRPKGEMQQFLYEKIVNDISLYSAHDTQFWIAFMGEPLTNGTLALERLNYAVKKGLTNINLNTNLVPANKELCYKLIDTGINKIIVSLDAATSEVYDKIRCGGNFNKVLENIDNLLVAKLKNKSNDTEIIVQFIVMDENQQEIEAFKKLFLDKKITLKIRGKLAWGNTIEANNLDLPNESRDYPCPWSNRGFVIHVTGQVGQCDMAWDGKYYYGDINHQSIAEIWNGKLANLRERHWNLDFNFDPCDKCKDWQCGRAEIIYCGKHE